MGVTAVDDDITLLKHGDELLDHIVNCLACLDHHHDLAGLFKRSNKLLKRISTDNVLAVCTSLNKILYLFGGTVVYRNGKTLALHVHDQVLAHYGKTDKSDV